MAITTERLKTEAQEIGTAVKGWVETVAETAGEAAGTVDLNRLSATASDVAASVAERVAASAPVAAVVAKKTLKRTLVGIVVAAAAAYFFDPTNGAQRRARVKAALSKVVSDIYAKASEAIGNGDTRVDETPDADLTDVGSTTS